jgi:glutathione S-transferase
LHSFPAIGYIAFGMTCDDEEAKKKFAELQSTHFPILMETFLKDTKFVFSDTPTIADLSIALPLVFIQAREKFWEAVPDKVKDYFNAVKEAFPHTAEEFGMISHMCSNCESPGAKLEL